MVAVRRYGLLRDTLRVGCGGSALGEPIGRSPRPAARVAGGRPPSIISRAALPLRVSPSRRIAPSILGRAVENRLIEYIQVLSRGELLVFRPETDVEGTDLHVNRRHRNTIIKVQVKGRSVYDKHGALFLNFAQSDVPAGDSKYLLVAEYHEETAEFGRYIWIVHAEDFRRLARTWRDQFKTELSVKASSKDRWTPYRYEVKEVARAVDALLETVERGEELLRTAAQVRAAWGGRRR